ncbi:MULTISPECIES: hypothetical protein [Streptomyces]|uniref:DUF732 domain-containing protein n=1 Tax=Streptomyces venezuelae TaxID=54571 RepID=A0A5P2BAZ9_STRVZ|nr:MULTISPECIES: hypothetical protein [Streptomyces]NDZ98622.1 hypothetical protein [Streptomyces sp. SID10116]MYY86106.1 hypothetical protein [Streptomyces sp. SID335]MYZ18327.1 hypothetical protein [Streptomyces sp. SID337]NDZ89553.1 hypothetical protein [Streptomyces sp. SID10115]NEB44269.1 hypothetical protein [Streptomyces sp. SID339]
MLKRLPRLTLPLLTVLVLGTTGCGASDTDASDGTAADKPRTPSASASVTPSAPPAPKGRGLKGAAAAFFLKTLRENYPDLDHIDDDALVAEGDALCTVRGPALGDQFTESTRRLGTTKVQTSRIMGVAHGLCRDKDDQLFDD